MMAPGDPQKVCRKCLAERSISDFYASKKTRDGLFSWCKECAREDARTRARKNKATNDVSPTTTDKVCSSCGVTKPPSEFGRNSNAVDGLRSSCSVCFRAAERKRKRSIRITASKNVLVGEFSSRRCRVCGVGKQARSFRINPDRRGFYEPTCDACEEKYATEIAEMGDARVKEKAASLKNQSGATLATYFDLVREQSGRCGICDRERTNRDLCVDHDHVSGVVRGLLCDLCNTAIGKMQDDPSLLRKAALYIESGGLSAVGSVALALNSEAT